MQDGPSEVAPPPHDKEALSAFIRANTKLMRPELVRELQLHLAEKSLPIWEKSEEELGRMNLPPPFWAFAWAGGQALARYLLDTPSIVEGKRVLDLGSGCGIVAIAAMKSGAAHALAADVDPFAGVAAKLNSRLNVVRIEATDDDRLDTTPDDRDVLLVGDLFYERELSARVVSFMERMAAAGVPVYVGDPRRSYFPIDRFEKVISYDVVTSGELEDTELKRTAVWRLKA
ncbi:MAG: 50S ribosomal protein L11 methyltransferase [Alphaproteobacteria bacterium]|nr:50S ribosomal protein L11 methyltransferase [Alphaproteobacteria bacterium]